MIEQQIQEMKPEVLVKLTNQLNTTAPELALPKVLATYFMSPVFSHLHVQIS